MKTSLLLTVLVAVTAVALRATYLLEAPVTVSPAVEIEVRPGATAAEIAAELEDRGVIRDARVLVALARAGGRDRDVRHGGHVFDGSLDTGDVLDELVRAPTPTVRVTIPEGLSWREIGDLLADAGVASADAYAEAVCDPALLAMAGASETGNCAEGYLFPDTYGLVPGMSAAAIAALQIRRFHEVVGELLSAFEPEPHNAFTPAPVLAAPDYRELAVGDDDARTTLVREVVVLASIIEKETSRPDERALISSVFHNRLRRGMKLQADPTVIYGLLVGGGPWDGNLTRAHLRAPDPYNTYFANGLPPGPICNPGRGSLEAALQPAATPLLYFVSRGDGSHHFSETLVEHNRAVAKYALR